MVTTTTHGPRRGSSTSSFAARRGSLDAPEQVILDLNQMGEGQKFMALGQWEVSDDGNLLAYTTDNVGFRQYRLHVRDLRTMQRPSRHRRARGFVGLGRGQSLAAVHRRRRGPKAQLSLVPARSWAPKPGKDPIVFEETDERFNIEVQKSLSKQFLLLIAASHISSEVRFLSSRSAEWRMETDCSTRRQRRVLRRSSRRHFLHQDQRHVSDVPPGDSSGRQSR